MKKIVIKTDKEIGKFLNNSYIDGKHLREVNEDDLINLQPNEYEIINTDNPLTIDDVNKIMGNLRDKYTNK
jgi:hypothetical protein